MVVTPSTPTSSSTIIPDSKPPLPSECYCISSSSIPVPPPPKQASISPPSPPHRILPPPLPPPPPKQTRPPPPKQTRPPPPPPPPKQPQNTVNNNGQGLFVSLFATHYPPPSMNLHNQNLHQMDEEGKKNQREVKASNPSPSSSSPRNAVNKPSRLSGNVISNSEASLFSPDNHHNQSTELHPSDVQYAASFIVIDNNRQNHH